MYLEKRPTFVTVIGWAWIIIGSLMCLSAAMVFFIPFMVGDIVQDGSEIPLIFKIFPVLALVQISVAVLGIVSGVNFLKLKPWSRNVLEVLTWFLLIFIIGFGIFWVYNWNSVISGDGQLGLNLIPLFMGIGIIGIYGFPLGIMLKYLRGKKVRDAIIGLAEKESGASGDVVTTEH